MADQKGLPDFSTTSDGVSEDQKKMANCAYFTPSHNDSQGPCQDLSGQSGE
jgi:hypothetical protein